MKTILHVHIFIRLCAAFAIIYGLYGSIVAWPRVMKLNKVMEKKKENALFDGREVEVGESFHLYLELLLSPMLVCITGVIAFVGTRKIVEWFIGRKQIDALVRADGNGRYAQSE